MAKPKRGFSEPLGGNSAAPEIQEMIAADKAKTGKTSPAKGKGAKRPKTERAPVPVQPVREAAPGEVLPPPLPLDFPEDERPAAAAPVKYDCRGLDFPQKTVERLRAFLHDRRFTHGERAAGALLILEFDGCRTDRQIISVKKLLSDSRGFSCTIRDNLIPKMVKAGLIQAERLRAKGTKITMLF